jgi:hypothetical protein
MHWADQGSLFLLEFMAQEIRELRCWPLQRIATAKFQVRWHKR